MSGLSTHAPGANVAPIDPLCVRAVRDLVSEEGAVRDVETLAANVRAMLPLYDRLARACAEGLARDILFCPTCGAQHVDGENGASFATAAHHTHLCAACERTWDHGVWSFGARLPSPDPGAPSAEGWRVTATGVVESVVPTPDGTQLTLAVRARDSAAPPWVVSCVTPDGVPSHVGTGRTVTVTLCRHAALRQLHGVTVAWSYRVLAFEAPPVDAGARVDGALTEALRPYAIEALKDLARKAIRWADGDDLAAEGVTEYGALFRRAVVENREVCNYHDGTPGEPFPLHPERDEREALARVAADAGGWFRWAEDGSFEFVRGDAPVLGPRVETPADRYRAQET